VTLRRIAEQSQPLAGLVVVDNDPSPSTRAVVEAHAEGLGRLEYVASPENLGPAGGLAVGMERVLDRTRPKDWIVLLDDGDPPQWTTMLGELLAFGQAMRAADRHTAGVGLIGARFDWASGRLVRPADGELDGPVAIDYIGGGQFPLYLAEAVRRVGPFSAPLFFGCDDLEYGLRLRRAGYSLYAPGGAVAAAAPQVGPHRHGGAPRRGLAGSDLAALLQPPQYHPYPAHLRRHHRRHPGDGPPGTAQAAGQHGDLARAGLAAPEAQPAGLPGRLDGAARPDRPSNRRCGRWSCRSQVPPSA
jgi:Glycosyl transferase family 2